jgi:4-hydroxy-tetrahydrodipicolinate reductase
VVIDFSFHDVTPRVAALCAENRKALVIGTTGQSPSEQSAIGKLQSAIPIVWASNYSTGVNTLFWLTRKAAEILGPGFDLEIVEMHHRLKKDAPSGTAATLAEILAAARKQQLQEVIRHGRHGILGERTRRKSACIPSAAVTSWATTVIFAADGERLELTHKASSRETFAHGALRAAQWICKQKPGIYNMQDVLGLRD